MLFILDIALWKFPFVWCILQISYFILDFAHRIFNIFLAHNPMLKWSQRFFFCWNSEICFLHYLFLWLKWKFVCPCHQNYQQLFTISLHICKGGGQNHWISFCHNFWKSQKLIFSFFNFFYSLHMEHRNLFKIMYINTDYYDFSITNKQTRIMSSSILVELIFKSFFLGCCVRYTGVDMLRW